MQRPSSGPMSLPSDTPAQRLDVDLLADLIRTPDFTGFRTHFERLVDLRLEPSQRDTLRSVAGHAFAALLDMARPDPELLLWFASHYDAGHIEPNKELAERLARLSRETKKRRAYEVGASPPQAGTVIQTRRVVQLSWFGVAGWQASEACRIKRSVFRSPQERTFMSALRLRFPHMDAFPNYPLDQLCELDRLRPMVASEIWRYALHCRLDAVLVSPADGEPVAVFELDSGFHDDPDQKKRDGWRNQLLMAASIPFYRLRSDDPSATSVDDWYQLLTNEVAHSVNVGDRLRTRDVHSMLVPL